MNIHGKPSHRWEGATEETQAKWQPIMAITPVRIECPCGALAVFLCLAVDSDGDICDGEAWCQACFAKAQAEEDDDD